MQLAYADKSTPFFADPKSTCGWHPHRRKSPAGTGRRERLYRQMVFLIEGRLGAKIACPEYRSFLFPPMGK